MYLQDFNVIKDHAIIAKTRGQTGLYFPLIVVKYVWIQSCNFSYLYYTCRQQNDSKKLMTVPGDWMDEQTIIRYFNCKPTMIFYTFILRTGVIERSFFLLDFHQTSEILDGLGSSKEGVEKPRNFTPT